MATPNTCRRVLTYLQRSGEKTFNQANFIQCLVNWVNNDSLSDYADVYFKVDDAKLILSDGPLDPNDKPVKFKRPHFCPIHNLSESERDRLPPETLSRGVDVGAAVIVESSDNKILLIRRAEHLRTFPGIWVPPGGHLEVGEQCEEAGLRELEEESGLKITPSMCREGAIPVLAVWESTFPPMLSGGLPRRHHAVVYLHVRLVSPYTAEHLQSLLKPDPEEVGACTWIDKKMAEAIVATSGELPQKDICEMPPTFRSLIVPRDAAPYMMDLESSLLLNKATGQVTDTERVSTGTKFALSEWLKTSKAV